MQILGGRVGLVPLCCLVASLVVPGYGADYSILNKGFDFDEKVGTIGFDSPVLASAVSEYRDPSDLYIGWGYPNVFQVTNEEDDTMHWRMLYQGFATESKGFDKWFLAAESDDLITWRPHSLGSAAPIRYEAPPNAVLHLGSLEAGLALNDSFASSHDSRLKVLLTNTTILTSADGLEFTTFKDETGQPIRWEKSDMDPGFGALRTANGTIVVTSRPKALRANGRHAGLHYADSWSQLGSQDAHVNLPLDNQYQKDSQIYGLPVFRVSPDTYFGWMWKYHCTPSSSGVCYHGGNVTASFATPLNNNAPYNWTSDSPPIFPGESLPHYRQMYPNSLAQAADGWYVFASGATVEHGYTPSNTSAILTFRYQPWRLSHVMPRTNSSVVVTIALPGRLTSLHSLKVNLDCGKGRADLSLLNGKGDEIHAVSTSGNEFDWKPFQHESTVLKLQGQSTIKITLFAGAKLYSVHT